jgi:hypothetical protein
LYGNSEYKYVKLFFVKLFLQELIEFILFFQLTKLFF